MCHNARHRGASDSDRCVARDGGKVFPDHAEVKAWAESRAGARDVAKKLIEAQFGATAAPPVPARDMFDYPLIVAT